MLVFQAYWLASTALFPKVINNARDRYKKPISTLIGLAIIAPTMLIGFVLLGNLPNPLVNAIGFLIAVLPLLFGAIGSAGLCQLIGHGLPAPTDQAQNWKRVWRGGWVLNFCYLLPFAGWFVILPWGIINGCGAFVLSLGKNKQANNRARGRGNQRAPKASPPHSHRPSRCPRMTPRRALRQQRTQIPLPGDCTQKTKRQRSPRPPRTPKEN